MKRSAHEVKGERPQEAKPELSPLISDPSDVGRRLLAWYGREGRDLPWRQTRDPYRIWLSEIMLQQTTVAAVIPYYERFLVTFPTVAKLAAAHFDQVLELWAGLGYYSRARNLHEAAKMIVNDHAGIFPESLEGLLALPGVGRSTAGAILCIAFDRPAAILDGNVRRVLVRLFAWTGNPRSSRAEQQLWHWASLLTSRERPHDYAQAIMDLGATLCTPRQPACRHCPLQDLCRAFRLGLAEALPAKRPKRDVPTRRQVALIVTGEKGLLVRQRSPDGLLGGLWEFPTADVEAEQETDQTAKDFAGRLSLAPNLACLGTIRHAYSHFKLELEVFVKNLDDSERRRPLDGRWCAVEDLVVFPLHGAHRKAYELFQQWVLPPGPPGSGK